MPINNSSPKRMILPGPDDRTLIVGRTGSGKTIFGMWLLSMVYEEHQIWIVIDYKREHQIGAIPYVQHVPVGTIPDKPGLYIVQPFPNEDISEYLMKIWEHENIGLYIDEGVMLANNDALDTLLIQGRSKSIPVIMLTQRPVGISRYAFSESQYFVVFPSHDRRERKTISEFTNLFAKGDDLDEVLLPRFHSYYYDVANRESFKLSPVEGLENIYARFETKLKPPEPVEVVQETAKAERRLTFI